MLLFDSYAPHRSETNRTEHARRALYLTYNARSAGDFETGTMPTRWPSSVAPTAPSTATACVSA